MHQTRCVPDDDKSPVDQVLDLFVFAPVGLAVTARTQLPEIVAKGRAQVEGQLTLARFLGQFAVTQGKSELEKRIKAYTSPKGSPGPTPAPTPSPTPSPAAAPPAEPADTSEPPASVTLPVSVRAEPAPDAAGESSEPLVAAPAVGDLAIPGYDALSASQVVQRLAGLSPAELELVRLSEGSTRGRKTVLTKISQLQ